MLFSSPKGSENKKTKISELGKYISYCTLSRAITITYSRNFEHDKNDKRIQETKTTLASPTGGGGAVHRLTNRLFVYVSYKIKTYVSYKKIQAVPVRSCNNINSCLSSVRTCNEKDENILFFITFKLKVIFDATFLKRCFNFEIPYLNNYMNQI